MPLKVRKPTGAVPWPLILLEGGEKSGRSWALAELSASAKVGRTFWLDIGEGAADEYGAVPGARYEVVDHDGSWADILGQVVEVKAEAQRAADAGEPPVVLGIDTMTAEWDMLKDWATARAARSDSNKERLKRDPNAEVKVSMNLWNDATARHRRLMTHLMTFPGIVVMIARGKEVASLDANGRPVEGTKEYKVEGHKTLAYDASVWVRLSRDHPPLIVGARSVHAGIRPGVDKPKQAPQFTLEWLIFDVLKCDPSKAHARNLAEAPPELTPEQIRDEAIRPGTTVERLGELYKEGARLGYGDVVVDNEHGRQEVLPDLLSRLGTERRNAAQGREQAAARLGKLWAEAEITDPADQLAYATETVGRDVTSLDELTAAEGKRLVERLARFVTSQAGPPEPEAPASEPETPAPEAAEPSGDQPAAAEVPSAQEIADEAMNTEDPDTLGALQSLADKAGKLNDDITAGGKTGKLHVLLRRRLQMAKARATQRENERQKNEAAA